MLSVSGAALMSMSMEMLRNGRHIQRRAWLTKAMAARHGAGISSPVRCRVLRQSSMSFLRRRPCSRSVNSFCHTAKSSLLRGECQDDSVSECQTKCDDKHRDTLLWREGLSSLSQQGCTHSSLIIARPTIVATNMKVNQSSLAIEEIIEIIAALFVSTSTPPVTGCTHASPARTDGWELVS